jgi:hypothetical protein
VSELFKAALAGAWTWVITYLFPASLALGLAGATLSTLEPSSAAVEAIEDWSAGYQTAAAVAAAVLLAMVLAGLNNGLHRVLEGYVLIPRSKRLWDWLVQRQVDRCKKLKEKIEAATGSDPGSELRKALLRERLQDYPVDHSEFGPTRYANSVRTMETYAVSRFQLDSQYLWGELTASTPEAARTAEEDARSFVDFLVNLVFLTGTLVVGAGAYTAAERDLRWLFVTAAFAAVTFLWNRLLHAAVRSWRSATRAVVDLGRAPLADALKLSLPVSIEREQEMWKTLVWALRDRHEPSITQLQRFRTDDSHSSGASSQALEMPPDK